MFDNQQFQQLNVNLQTAVQNLFPAITYCEQNRIIAPQEGQQIRNALSQPVNLENFKRNVEITYGYQQVAPQVLFDFCVKQVSIAAQKLRSTYNAVPGSYGYSGGTVNMQQYATGYNNGYAQPVQQVPNQFGYGQAAYNPYLTQSAYQQPQQPAPAVHTEIANIYGVVPNNGQAFNGAPTPNANQAPVARSVEKPWAATTHTNKPYEIEGLEDNLGPVIATLRPATDEENPLAAANDEQSSTAVRWGRSMSVLDVSGESNISGDAVVEEPLETVEDVVDTVLEETPEMFREHYANVVTVSEPEVIEVDYEAGKSSYLKCASALKSKKGIGGILALLQQLDNLNTNFRMGMTKLILKMFNEAAAVNFVRLTPEGITRLPEVTTIPDLGRMIVDSPEDFIPDWRVNKEDYQKALKLTLRDSIYRIFSNNAKKFLNPHEVDDRDVILGTSKITLKVNGKKLKASALTKTDQKSLDNIKIAMNNIFVILVDKRVLVTDLNFIDAEPGDTSLRLLDHTTKAEAAGIMELLKKYGNLEIVNPNYPEYIEHPVKAGEIYDGQVLLRRE